jgi:hypothetical protein
MAEAVAKSLEGSLARLRLDRIDIFHLHNAITETGGGESLSVRQVRVALASFALAGFTALSLASTAQLGDCHRLVKLGDRAEHLADQLGRGRLTDVLGGQVQVYFASTWQMIDFPLAPAAPIVAPSFFHCVDPARNNFGVRGNHHT